MRGYGFTQVPYQRRGGGFGEFWENFYSWWVMWAYNPVSAKSHHMLDLQRTEFWISRERFLEKYGSSQKKCNGPEVHKEEAIVGPGSVG